MAWIRNLDLVLLALALALFVVAGLPLLGWLTALVIWVMWRSIGALAERRAAAASDLGRMAAIATGSMIGRGWLMGLGLLVLRFAVYESGLYDKIRHQSEVRRGSSTSTVTPRRAAKQSAASSALSGTKYGVTSRMRSAAW